jgi:hypothetical protein
MGKPIGYTSQLETPVLETPDSGIKFDFICLKYPMSILRNILLMLAALTFTITQSCEIEGDDIINPEDPRTRFLGEWKVSEDCTRGNYMVDIQLDPNNSTQILLNNFGNPGPGYDPAVGLVVSKTIKVSTQIIGEGWTVNGEGSYTQDGSIQWSYSLMINGVEKTCSAVYTR